MNYLYQNNSDVQNQVVFYILSLKVYKNTTVKTSMSAPDIFTIVSLTHKHTHTHAGISHKEIDAHVW